jgi:hypothetical protein
MQGNVNKAHKGIGYIDRGILSTEEPGVIAAVAEEELVFKA